MSSIPEASGSQTTPAPTYLGEDQHDGHRLRAGVVALIIAVIVAVAAGITAAVVFTHKPNSPQPPQPSPGGQLVQPAASPAVSGRHTPAESIGGPPVSEGTSENLGSGNSVSLSNGVSLTPASGWTVSSSSDSAAAVNKDDGTASLLVLVGTVKGTDVEQVLNSDIAQAIQKLGMDNVQVTRTETGQVQSPNFQEVAKQGFKADVSTQQGTKSVVGMFLEFLNTKTQNAAFVMFMAKDGKAFDAAVDDVNGMIKSILGAASQ